jgi:WD40 repeat protein
LLLQHGGGHASRVAAVAFSPDGSRVVSCAGERKALVWNVQVRLHLSLPVAGDIFLFSPCDAVDVGVGVAIVDVAAVAFPLHRGRYCFCC